MLRLRDRLLSATSSIVGLGALLGTSACSTLSQSRGYFLDRVAHLNAEGLAVAEAACPKPGAHGERFKVAYGPATLEVFVFPVTGFRSFGPVLVPIIPLFWLGSSGHLEVHALVTGSVPKDTLTVDYYQWRLKRDDGDWVVPDVPYPGELGFGMSQDSVPQRLILRIDGISLEGKPQPAAEVALVRKSHWKYSPLVLPTEGPPAYVRGWCE